MRKWKKLPLYLVGFCLSGFLLLSGSYVTMAEVRSTKEQTAGEAIYVAGNPDLYPLEYYNEETKAYEGVLPEIYQRIAKKQGMDLCYVSAGSDNLQDRLAKNNQVEFVSAHYQGEVKGLQEEYQIASFEKKGKKYTICIGFTGIASGDTVELLKKELEVVDNQVILSNVLAETVDKRNQPSYMWWIVIIVALTGICTLLINYMFRVRYKKKKQDEMSYVDPLTGIGNSAYFKAEYENRIAPESSSLYYITYIAMPIHRLYQFFGEKKGEEIQIYAADMLSSSITDRDFLARIDEGIFALAVQSVTKEDAINIVKELLDQLNAYDENFLKEYRAEFRAGVYGLATAFVSCETAIYHARQGYHHAIQRKQEISYCDKVFLGQEEVRIKLQRKLTDALKNNRFVVVLQFIVTPEDGRICGAEALSRWNDVEEGELSPEKYIESMIDAGIVDRLDFYIFEQVCSILEQWGQETQFKDMFISCNFCRSTVERSDFLQRFQNIVQKYKFDRRNLVMELTEDTMTENQAVIYQHILACRDMGFRIALDDVGSGYTSFKDLCDYPADIVKMDRGIVIEAVTEKGYALLQGVVRLLHDLALEVLCEGVETEEQNQCVKQVNCDYIQGYYYSRVIPLEYSMDFCENYMRKLEEKGNENGDWDSVRE